MPSPRFRYTLRIPEASAATAAGSAAPPTRLAKRDQRRFRRRGECEEEQLEYLRGLPTMPDFLAHLAGYVHLTAAETECIDRQVTRLCRAVREARARWEATSSDELAWVETPSAGPPCQSTPCEK